MVNLKNKTNKELKELTKEQLDKEVKILLKEYISLLRYILDEEVKEAYEQLTRLSINVKKQNLEEIYI